MLTIFLIMFFQTIRNSGSTTDDALQVNYKTPGLNAGATLLWQKNEPSFHTT
jgi:hypothetical protein